MADDYSSAGVCPSAATAPFDHVRKFLRHKRIASTQIYAETSLRGLGEAYSRALGQR